MRILGGDKRIVTSTGFQDIRINIWEEKYGPSPKPVGVILLLILAVVALVGMYFVYDLGYDEPKDKTASLQEDLENYNESIQRLMRPPEEETEIKKIEAEIEVLRSARESINAGYGYFAATVKAIDDTIPPTASWKSLNLGAAKITLQGDADTPSGLFAIANAFEERSEFEKAYIKNIGTTRPSGRVVEVMPKDAGSVYVTQMLLLEPGESGLSSLAPGGGYFSDLIKDPTQTASGGAASAGGGEQIQAPASVVMSTVVVSGTLTEPPVTIQFNAVADFYYPIDKYKWEFSDGSEKEVDLGDPGPRHLPISTLHTFIEEGDASAELTVIDDHGHKVSATKGGIFASADVDFTAELVSCDNPLKLKFKPQIVSAEKITSYKWYFDKEISDSEDATEPDSTDMVPIHTFNNTGEHTVTLTVAGRLEKPISKSHMVMASGTPTANFYPDRVRGAEEFAVRFADASVPDGETDSAGNEHKIVQWEWNFGDGTTLSGSPNPVHTYSGDGPYTVTLKVWESDANCAAITKTIQACNAEYSQFFIEPGNSELTINFSAPALQSDSADFLWDFGVVGRDGKPVTSTEANPSHKYDTSGTYHVTLRISEEEKSTIYAVESVVSFISADIEVISSTSTSFQLEIIPAVPED